jgi:hypothetical protein
MNKFKTSLIGYRKKTVEDLLKRLQSEHDSKKKSLESELNLLKMRIKKEK